MSTVHPINMPSRGLAVTCPTCSRSYSNKFNLQRHYAMIHLHLLRFVCEQCGKSLSSKQNYKEHKYTHTGEKPFQCKDCGARFRQCSQLSVHKRVHRVIPSFPCELKLTSLLNSQKLPTFSAFHSAIAPLFPAQPLPPLHLPKTPCFSLPSFPTLT